MLKAMQKKTGVAFTASPEVEKLFEQHTGTLSGADIEAVLIRSKMKAMLAGRSTVESSDVSATLADFIPSSSPDEVELQTLAAVLECTSRSLLPERYRNLDRAGILSRIENLPR